MAWSMSEVERFVDPRFGPDPYFKRVAGRAECSERHLEYMFKVCWPLLKSFRMVIVTQRGMTTYTAIVLFAAGDRDIDYLGAGHIMYTDFPGKGKTLLGKVPAIVLGGTFGRFQGDPEKMPSDFVGYMYPRREGGQTVFKLKKGPAFDDIILVDEVNRTNPRALASILTVIGEGVVAIENEIHHVRPFVLFTMNPIEAGGEGTYPLPEALLDRIMLEVNGEWFMAKDFADIEDRTNEFPILRQKLVQVCDMDGVQEIREFFTREINLNQELKERRMGKFAEITNDPYRFGCLRDYADRFGGPIILSGLWGRGFIHWVGAVKTLAAFRYRNYVIPEDAWKMLLPVLRHRAVFSPGVLEYFQLLCKRQGSKFTDCSHADCKHRSTEETKNFILSELIREAW